MQTPVPGRVRSIPCLAILIIGLVLRTIVFYYLPPQNNDNHYEVICYIHNIHQIPPAAVFNQAYHPPLYHMLAAVFVHFGDVITTQYLSLLLSLTSLLILYRLILRLPWLDERLKPWCLALPALHPEFIIYTLLVSNDTLAILLGVFIFDRAAHCLERPSLARQIVLALGLGLGLLTKYTFLAFILPVALLIFIVNVRASLTPRTQALRILALLLMAATAGGYRYVDNALRYGNPLISNLDFPNGWAAFQRPTWVGLSTLLDINIFKLVREPVITPSTAHAWPLLLYGSFWYSFFPEFGFLGNLTKLKILGRMIYLTALAPTLLMAAGLMLGLRAWIKNVRIMANPSNRASAPWDGRRVYEAFSLLVFLGILGLVMGAGWKYDVWSIFQGRLFFPAYMCLIMFLHEGLQRVARWRPIALGVRILLTVLFALFLGYFAGEFGLIVRHPVHPSVHFFENGFTLDMKE